MMNILNLASDSSSNVRSCVIIELANIAKKVSRKAAWKELSEHGFVVIAQQIAKLLGIRLTKGKLSMLIPAAGAVFNSGYNVYMMNNVCTFSYMFYRERHIARYYNDDGLIC